MLQDGAEKEEMFGLTKVEVSCLSGAAGSGWGCFYRHRSPLPGLALHLAWLLAF